MKWSTKKKNFVFFSTIQWRDFVDTTTAKNNSKKLWKWKHLNYEKDLYVGCEFQTLFLLNGMNKRDKKKREYKEKQQKSEEKVDRK
jgi:hypothetical protein